MVGNWNFLLNHINLGSALQSQGLLDECVASYRQALAINPSFASAYNNLGLALRESGKLEEAAECYQQASRQD